MCNDNSTERRIERDLDRAYARLSKSAQRVRFLQSALALARTDPAAAERLLDRRGDGNAKGARRGRQ